MHNAEVIPMSDCKDQRWRALWLIPPTAIGVLVLLYMMNGKQARSC